MTTEVLWISANEIDQLGISMAEIMDAVETGFAAMGRGEGEMPAKIGIHPRENSFTHAMPCYIGGGIDKAGVKCISGYPTNPAKGHPYITGIMLLTDPETGLPQAVMDAGWITAWRTGAASGVYARHFGTPDTESMSIVGTGVQARVNLLAMQAVFPKLNTVKCYGIREASMDRFISDMQPQLPDATISKHADLQEAVSDTDVLITCTPMVEHPERGILQSWLKESHLAIAVDYDSAIGEDVFADAHFTCDNRNQYAWTQKQGVFFQNGYPLPDDIDADMGEICAGRKQGVREGKRGAVLMGIGSHDVMTAALVYEHASVAGVGTKVEL
ncbi:ornithine cyclodeaminase family protein [Pseudodesulfovibrio sediminis]|uniref:Alanine dehydrogenase n=1 Tax=Pseudodesulfovibrio sediminis TaxID=2810563 RepID=A0ABN6EPE8_9BACT|nr:ornithine cyclodeaminase family protein [Pseudodesulfovibrio sediminis]BCS86936.1 alanine dehydrogenase [Pseudodesulfovibrio sediminis]